ncbi:MAG: hypothetical protein C6Y20_11390 [Tagaea sp. CACIAM 22H2]|nr:hypothetical protein [Tagaea sp. CACIAM 22H2]
MKRVALLGIALALAACADTSRVHTPVVGGLSYFNYLAGNDIKAACTADAPARYRFVYNAVFDEQVRSYDLQQTADGAKLSVNVGNSEIRVFEFPLSWPIRPEAVKRQAEATLSRADYLALIRQVEADGFGAAAPEGMRLQSYDFYWAVSACAGGKFHFNAWVNQTPGFAALRFPQLLYSHDTTSIPPAKPFANTYGAYISRRTGDNGPDRNFEMVVRNGELGNILTPF